MNRRAFFGAFAALAGAFGISRQTWRGVDLATAPDRTGLIVTNFGPGTTARLHGHERIIDELHVHVSTRVFDAMRDHHYDLADAVMKSMVGRSR